jgi:hypothetical protein
MASPYLAELFTLQLSLSNAKAKQELGWTPMFPTYREGLRDFFQRAA